MSRRTNRTLTSVALACLIAAATAGVASAREPVDPSTLNPPPPASFNAVCATQGAQTVCELAFSDPLVSDEPSGIICHGTELLVSQTRDVVGKRFYDADGDLLRRHFGEQFAGSFTNPVTGKSVDFVAHNTIIHDLAVPGEIAPATTAITGHQMRIFLPGGGSVLIDAGRIVVDESTGEILGSSGPKHFDDYFVRGDTHALDALCDAVS